MADSYEKDEERQKLAEEATDKSRKAQTRKDDMADDEMGADLDDDLGLEPDEDVDVEVRPHGHGAIHDMHDFYSAGQGAIEGHLQQADNPELKSLLNDHRDQLEAMSQEARDLCQKDYPEHPQPEPYESDAMKSTDPVEEGEEVDGEETAQEDAIKSRTKKARKDDEDEDEGETEKRRRQAQTTRKSRTADPAANGAANGDGKTVPLSVFRSLERKTNDLLALVEDLTAE